MDTGIEQVWSDWKAVRLLGEGSFGKVYEVVRDQFGIIERSAVKVIAIPASDAEVQSLRNDGLTDHDVTAYYTGLVKEFAGEISLMSKLRRFGNIVGYEDYAVVERKDRFGWDIYIRMELLTSLPAYMARQGKPFDETDVIKMAIDLCTALEVCYERHIVHRDIKPDNIFVSEDGEYKLGDFGVAKTVEKTVSGLSKKGTYTYMAPEIYKGEPGGMNSDLYSLGIVMYKLLNDNREPFLPPITQVVQYEQKQQALLRRMNGESLPRMKMGSDVLWEIVERACESDATKRWQNPTALKNALLSVQKSGDVKRTVPKPVPPKPVTPPPPKPDVDATVAVRKAEETKTTAVRSPSPKVEPLPPAKEELPPNKKRRGGKMVLFVVLFLMIAAMIGTAILLLRETNDNVTRKRREAEELHLTLPTTAEIELDDEPKDEPSTSTATPLEVMNTVFNGYSPEFGIYGGDYTNMVNEETGASNYDGVPGPINVGNEEAGLENLFVCSADAQALIDNGASAIDAMNGNIFTAVTYHLKDASSAEFFATLMTDSIKNNHWFCGAPEKLVIVAVDSNNILVVFGSNDAVNPFMDQVKSVYSDASVLVEEAIVS